MLRLVVASLALRSVIFLPFRIFAASVVNISSLSQTDLIKVLRNTGCITQESTCRIWPVLKRVALITKWTVYFTECSGLIFTRTEALEADKFQLIAAHSAAVSRLDISPVKDAP